MNINDRQPAVTGNVGLMEEPEEKPNPMLQAWWGGDQDKLEAAIGRTIRGKREERRMSQRHLVEVLNEDYGLAWHQTTLAKAEAGERPVRLSEALALADALDVPIEMLTPISSQAGPEAPASLLRARATELARTGRQMETRRLHLLKLADEIIRSEALYDEDSIADI